MVHLIFKDSYMKRQSEHTLPLIQSTWKDGCESAIWKKIQQRETSQDWNQIIVKESDFVKEE